MSDRDAVTPKKNAKAPKNGSRLTRRSAVAVKLLNPLASDSEPLTDLDTDSNDHQEDVFLSRTTQKKTPTSPDPPANSKPRPKPRFEPKEHRPDDGQEAESAGTPTPTSPRPASGGKRAPPSSDDEVQEDAGDEAKAQDKEGNVSQNGEETEAGSPPFSPAPSSQTGMRRPQKRQASPTTSEASLADFTTSRKRVRR
jgi:hypothetical protein